MTKLLETLEHHQPATLRGQTDPTVANLPKNEWNISNKPAMYQANHAHRVLWRKRTAFRHSVQPPLDSTPQKNQRPPLSPPPVTLHKEIIFQPERSECWKCHEWICNHRVKNRLVVRKTDNTRKLKVIINDNAYYFLFEQTSVIGRDELLDFWDHYAFSHKMSCQDRCLRGRLALKGKVKGGSKCSWHLLIFLTQPSCSNHLLSLALIPAPFLWFCVSNPQGLSSKQVTESNDRVRVPKSINQNKRTQKTSNKLFR